MTFYATTIEKARELMSIAFDVFPTRTVRLMPHRDGYAVQVI